MSSYKYAPILIPTLCRYSHFRNCVVSLSKCTYADRTTLFIALDYPANDAHVEGYNKIKTYIPQITGFKSVIVIKRTENYGAYRNYKEAEAEVCEKNDRFIFSEDDNVFSPNFLCYINEGLQKYEDDDRVTAVVGYNYPIDIKGCESEIYLSHYYSAWGTGFWKRKRREYTKETVDNEFLKIKNVIKLYLRNPRLINSLIKISNDKNILEDVCVTADNFINGKYSLFPKMSKVQNFGNDGSGEHSKTNGRTLFTNQLLDSSKTFEIDSPKCDKQPASIERYFSISLFDRLSILKKIIKFYLQ